MKYVWGFITVIIVLSMVVTYSGFTMLARTPAPTEAPENALDTTNPEAEGQLAPEVQQMLDEINASTTLKLNTAPLDDPATTNVGPETAPVPKLDFSL